MITPKNKLFCSRNPFALEQGLAMGLTLADWKAIRTEVARGALARGEIDQWDYDYGMEKMEEQANALGLTFVGVACGKGEAY